MNKVLVLILVFVMLPTLMTGVAMGLAIATRDYSFMPLNVITLLAIGVTAFFTSRNRP